MERFCLLEGTGSRSRIGGVAVPNYDMKGVSARLRSSPRGAVDAVVKEREPFCVGPHRAKSASPARKGRSNGENVPPDVNVSVVVCAVLLS